MTGTVLILGPSGKIGRYAAQEFWNAGWTVRRYRRGTDMTAAAKGADVIVNGLNPLNYHNWAKLIPQITAQVLAAARASGAAVIIPGNVYNYGDQPGPWSEHTPQRPVSRKGQIRVEMEAAYRASGVQTIILRAGNFIDPDEHDDLFGRMMATNLSKGRLTAAGRTDARQAYAWLPDWARAARMLAERRESLARFEDVPFAGHDFSVNELAQELSLAMSRKIRVGRFPWWAMTLASPVWELARELREMRYLFDLDHSLDGARLAELLPEFRPTDRKTVMRGILSEAKVPGAEPPALPAS